MSEHFWSDIVRFHAKFQLPRPPVPRLLPDDVYNFRARFLQEELDEFRAACAGRNLADAADALVDLAYVAFGTAYLMGLDRPAHWAEVQRANLGKVRADRAESSKRGHALDVVKPPGWTPPDHAAILQRGR